MEYNKIGAVSKITGELEKLLETKQILTKKIKVYTEIEKTKIKK